MRNSDLRHGRTSSIWPDGSIASAGPDSTRTLRYQWLGLHDTFEFLCVAAEDGLAKPGGECPGVGH